MNYKYELQIYGTSCEITIYKDLQGNLEVNNNQNNTCFTFQSADENQAASN